MRVGYLNWEPCVLRDSKTGDMTGIYVDMVKQIATDLNVKVTWVETTLANFAAGLQSGQYDFSVGPTFITIARSTAVAFSEPVNYVGNSGVVLKGSRFKPVVPSDLQKPGLRIAVLQGQALDEYCRRNLPAASLIVISGSDLTAPLTAVSVGRADIGLMNSVTVSRYVREHAEVEQVLLGENQIEMLPLSWAVRRDDTQMLQFLDSAITYLKTNGRLADYQRRYPIPLLYDIPHLAPAR
jgi:polar amino acid transport system substrate-binding protein